jgi:hypothetical protein
MIDQLTRILVLSGMNYFLIIFVATILFYRKKRLFFIFSILTSVFIYILALLPIFNYDLNNVVKAFNSNGLTSSEIFVRISILGLAHVFVLFITFYKKNYLRKYREGIIFFSLLSFGLYCLGFITLELELSIIGSLLLFTITLLIKQINLADKDPFSVND